MKVLVVEDDLHLAEALQQIFIMENYFVDVVNDGIDGLYYASNNDYDIIILDVMLPKMNGYDVIKTLRKQNNSTPTIMLTAKTETIDKIIGLDSGADDYMVKPFSPEELLARVRAVSRRIGDVVLDELNFNNLKLNINTYTLSFLLKSVKLSKKEFTILKILMSNPTSIVSKEELIIKAWGIDSEADDNNVEVYVSFLRKKLNFIDSNVIIDVIRKVGYKLEIKPND